MSTALMTEQALADLRRRHGEEEVARGLDLVARGLCAACSFWKKREPAPAVVAGIFDPQNKSPAGTCPHTYCQACADELEGDGWFEPLDGAR